MDYKYLDDALEDALKALEFALNKSQREPTGMCFNDIGRSIETIEKIKEQIEILEDEIMPNNIILDAQTNLPIRKYLIEYYQDNKRHTTWFYASRIGDILKDVAEIKGKILNSQYATKKDLEKKESEGKKR